MGEEKLFNDLGLIEDMTSQNMICTSRHTNSSNGSVVNMLSPKQNRATLIRVSFLDRFRAATQVKREIYRCKVVENVSLCLVCEHKVT